LARIQTQDKLQNGKVPLLNTHAYDHHTSFLKRTLTPDRFEHSVGVMRVMEELAEVYSLDPDQAVTAGLVHDAAKDMTEEDQLALAEQAHIVLAHPSERHPIYLHAPVGAYVAATELGITDRLVLDAIAAHSWSGDGKNFDAPLAQCLRAADLIASVAEWNGREKLKRVVYAGQIEQATLLQCAWLIEFFQARAVPIHPNLTTIVQSLSTKLGTGESFFERW
jgi:predicted HD superfamily hydrolase involved in NAD metabolism